MTDHRCEVTGAPRGWRPFFEKILEDFKFLYDENGKIWMILKVLKMVPKSKLYCKMPSEGLKSVIFARAAPAAGRRMWRASRLTPR